MDLAAHLRALLDELAVAQAQARTDAMQHELAGARHHLVRAVQLVEQRPAILGRRR